LVHGRKHVIDYTFAEPRLLQPVHVFGSQNVDGACALEIFQNRTFAHFVTGEIFEVGKRQHLAIEHLLFQHRRNAVGFDFLTGTLAVGRQQYRRRMRGHPRCIASVVQCVAGGRFIRGNDYPFCIVGGVLRIGRRAT
jgi:hypothetical protein